MNVKLLCITVGMSVALLSETLYAGENRHDSVCPKHLNQRTDAEVLQAHIAAFEAGNAELLACDYARDAVFMLPGSVVQGSASIQSTFGGFFSLAGGNIEVTTRSLTLADGVALFEYAVTSDHVEVVDGVDSFVIEKGLILAHTAHLGGLSVK
jgi:ketosteroid isomerase-like protein